MKTYKEYYDEYEISTESRDLAFDEWLMLLLDKQEKQMIDKSCKAFCDTCMGQCKDRSHCDTLQRFMNELMEE